jgi:hypothetical protein
MTNLFQVLLAWDGGTERERVRGPFVILSSMRQT